MLPGSAAKEFAFSPVSCKALRELFSRKKPFLTFGMLSTLRLTSIRMGDWVKLSSTEKALFRCALWIAQVRKRIVNDRLVAQVFAIAWHLLEIVQNRITVAGVSRARIMLETYSKPRGVFDWAPQVKEWLCDATYIFYLGVNSQP